MLSFVNETSLRSRIRSQSSWAAVSNSLTRLLLETPRTSTLDALLERIVTHLSELPTPAVTSRPLPAAPVTESADSPVPSRAPSPGPSSFDSLLSTLASSSLPRSPSNPLVPLLILSLFSSRSSLAALIPPHLATPLRQMFDDVANGNEVVREEVEFLTGQIGALGECCRAEEEGAGAACGCASKKGGASEVPKKASCH